MDQLRWGKSDIHILMRGIVFKGYEIHSDVYEAITREKRIKKWNQQWKINLIEQNNPQWLDVGSGLV